MINETEKLDKFKKAVYGEAGQQADEILKAAYEERDSRLARARANAENFQNTKFSEIDREFEEKKVKEISSESLRVKRNVLIRREQIIGRVFDNVRERLESFIQTPDYEKLMCRRVKECADKYPDEKGTVYITARDKALADKLTAGGRYTVKVGEKVDTGGMLIILENIGIAIDYTFDSALSEQRDNFVSRVVVSG